MGSFSRATLAAPECVDIVLFASRSCQLILLASLAKSGRDRRLHCLPDAAPARVIVHADLVHGFRLVEIAAVTNQPGLQAALPAVKVQGLEHLPLRHQDQRAGVSEYLGVS